MQQERHVGVYISAVWRGLTDQAIPDMFQLFIILHAAHIKERLVAPWVGTTVRKDLFLN